MLVTISDIKFQHSSDGILVDYYNSDLVTAQDYAPFGMGLPTRKYIQMHNTYRYGFNGKEKENDIEGDGNIYDYGSRILNPRIGRFLSVDPMTKSYPLLTPYQFAANSPIWGIDVDGLEFMPYLSAWFHIKTEVSKSTGGSIPYAVSSLGVMKTSIVINSANVSSVYKNNLGEPLFDAMGVGLTPSGRIQASDYAQLRSTGYNEIPQNPNWTLSPSPGLTGMPKSLSSTIQGTSTGVFKEGDKAVSPSFQVKTPPVFDNFNSGFGAIKEGMKYYQLYSDSKIWNASIDLSNNLNMFDVVTKIVNDTYANNDKNYFNGFNKGDLINFVLDGKLPTNKGVVATDAELIRNIRIMNVGMQIIENHNGENHMLSSGMVLPWNYYSTQVTSRTKEIYNQTVSEYERRHPKKQ